MSFDTDGRVAAAAGAHVRGQLPIPRSPDQELSRMPEQDHIPDHRRGTGGPRAAGRQRRRRDGHVQPGRRHERASTPRPRSCCSRRCGRSAEDPAVRVRRADRDRAGVLRRPGPARAHRPAAAPRRVAVADRPGALQPDRGAHRDDEQAGHRRPQRGRCRSGGRLRLRRGLPGAGRHGRLQPRLRRASRCPATPAPRGPCSGSSARPGPRSCCCCRARCRAEEALALGLATKVVPADELEAPCAELAAHAGGRPDAGLRLDPSCGGLLRRAHA